MQRPAAPPSATHASVAFTALVAFFASAGLLRYFQPFGKGVVFSATAMILAVAIAIFVVDLGWKRVYRRASTGMDLHLSASSWSRSLVKVLGLLLSLGFVAFLYWLLPEYHGSFYDRYYFLLTLIVPPWLFVAVPYFYWVDKRMVQPQDGYWHMGQIVLLRWRLVNTQVISQHLLGWLIKGFFFPLMFTYMCNDLDKFLNLDLSRLNSFGPWFDFLYDFLYFIDVGLVSVGYLMSFRLTDTHLRSSEPTMFGWAVALVCYQPFWSLFGTQYLGYDTDLKWGAWLWDYPVIYGIWGCSILVLTAIYVWATVSFGARFSNLTNRGIITNGPYRYSKHPAYIAKNLSWWLVSVPFVVRGSASESLRHCLLLLCLNGIYYLRALTEERHLATDPDYQAYSAWIQDHGMFARLLGR